jgi:hypothetical protein
MTNKRSSGWMRSAAVALLAVGIAPAQGPGLGWGASAQMGAQNGTQAGAQTATQAMAEVRLTRLTQLLTLDATQQAQAKAIFETAQNSVAALQTQIVAARTALQSAARAGKDVTAESAALAGLMAKAQAVQATAMGQFYNLLTPTQRDLFDKVHGAGMGFGMGMGRGAGMGTGTGMGMMRGAMGGLALAVSQGGVAATARPPALLPPCLRSVPSNHGSSTRRCAVTRLTSIGSGPCIRPPSVKELLSKSWNVIVYNASRRLRP